MGERRHVTVMFCDLVDSTGIAAKLDAEEWRDLVGGYIDAASAAVVEMGGKVAKKLGDGLMALFGHPVAQENDAERAVRAGLAIQWALAELNRKNASSNKPALAARIAIDLGPVVVDATGEIFGEVPNIAARAQALAEAGTVVVTARVQALVSDVAWPLVPIRQTGCPGQPAWPSGQFFCEMARTALGKSARAVFRQKHTSGLR
jgi:class 3 adenylate cyclase